MPDTDVALFPELKSRAFPNREASIYNQPSMHPVRIVELLEPFLVSKSSACHSDVHFADFHLHDSHFEARGDANAAVLFPAQLQDISTYIDILLKWNAHINLTAIRDPEDIVPRHFGESLFAARCLFPRGLNVGTAALGCPPEHSSAAFQSSVPPACPDAGRVANAAPSLADLGAGAGFPGLPIKLWAPHISLTLIESNHKKVAFLREVTRALTLTDVNIQNTRAETLTGTTFDVVTLRAVERFETILPTAATLVAPGGRLALLIGSAQVENARATLPDLAWTDPTPIPQSRARVLLTGQKPAK
jgi:16S rRNA (guanine527-N7)-methyltransferase